MWWTVGRMRPVSNVINTAVWIRFIALFGIAVDDGLVTARSVIGGSMVELLMLFVVPLQYAGFKEFKMNPGMDDCHCVGTEETQEDTTHEN